MLKISPFGHRNWVPCWISCSSKRTPLWVRKLLSSSGVMSALRSVTSPPLSRPSRLLSLRPQVPQEHPPHVAALALAPGESPQRGPLAAGQVDHDSLREPPLRRERRPAAQVDRAGVFALHDTSPGGYLSGCAKP